MFTHQQTGEKPVFRYFKGDLAEASWVIQTIMEELSEGKQLEDFAIMFRTNNQSRIIEENLIRAQIPYKVVKGLRFYERKEIKMALNYLGWINNASDRVAFSYILNNPPRKIGPKAQLEIFNHLFEKISAHRKSLQENNDPLANQENPYISPEIFLDWLEDVNLSKKISKMAFTSLQSLIASHRNVTNMLSQGVDLGVVVESVLTCFGVKDFFQKVKDDFERSERLDSLNQLSLAAERSQSFGSDTPLYDFLEMVSLSGNEGDKGTDKSVHLITVHNAKGLEYENVFIVGMEDEVFPHHRSIVANDISEERRLLYVATTRAKKKLFISAAGMKLRYGRIDRYDISRLVGELDRKLFSDKSNFSLTFRDF